MRETMTMDACAADPKAPSLMAGSRSPWRPFAAVEDDIPRPSQEQQTCKVRVMLVLQKDV